jgi:hypothetical protein
MAFYFVLLRREHTSGEVEVSAEGTIVGATAPLLHKAIGLSLRKFRVWVKGRGGEIYLIREQLPIYSKSSAEQASV